jgi:restriction endonuclease S subunit
VRLVDMLTFDRESFAKNISTTVKKKVKIESKWDLVRLGDLCNLYQPKTITSQEIKDNGQYKVFGANGIINIIGVGDFQNNIVPNLDSIEQIQIEGKLSEDYILQPNDLLVVRSNGSANLVGRFLLIDKILPNTSFSGFTIRLRPNIEKANSKYLCYYLRTEKVREELIRNSGGSNIKSLNQTLLSSLQIPLPSLPEQQKIVSEIEKIEAQISEAQEVIDAMPTLKNEVLKKYL